MVEGQRFGVQGFWVRSFGLHGLGFIFRANLEASREITAHCKSIRGTLYLLVLLVNLRGP